MKLYITLLCFMLAVIIIFTAFGIPYASNNFVGTIVIIERYLDNFSGWLLNFYNTVHNLIDEWLPKIAETLRPLGDLINSMVDFFKKIDEKFGVLDSISKFIEDILDFLKKTFGGFTIFFEYLSEYGLDVLNSNWRYGLTVSLKCANDNNFYNSDGSLDIEKIFKYVDAVVYLEDNEFSYILKNYGKSSILNYVSLEEKTIVGIYTSMFDKNSKLFSFSTVDLTIPNSYLPELLAETRFSSYFTDAWIPVIDSSDFPYSDDNYTYELLSFKICTPSVRNPNNLIPYLNGETSYQPYFMTLYDFQFYGTHRSIYLRFVRYDDAGKQHSKYMTLDQFLFDAYEKYDLDVFQGWVVKVNPHLTH